MQQAIEDRGGEDLVAGEEFGPVADAFVGGDEDAAAAVAVGDEAEEEAGFDCAPYPSMRRPRFVNGVRRVLAW